MSSRIVTYALAEAYPLHLVTNSASETRESRDLSRVCDRSAHMLRYLRRLPFEHIRRLTSTSVLPNGQILGEFAMDMAYRTYLRNQHKASQKAKRGRRHRHVPSPSMMKPRSDLQF